MVESEAVRLGMAHPGDSGQSHQSPGEKKLRDQLKLETTEVPYVSLSAGTSTVPDICHTVNKLSEALPKPQGPTEQR